MSTSGRPAENRVELAAVVEGPPDAPVLVMAPSLGATGAMWEPQASALRGRFRVIRVDARGHGASPVPPPPYELADLAGDVVRLLDRYGVDAAHFCGLSLGGMTGMALAARHPDRVRRLVLCCTSARMPPDPWAQRAAAVRAEGTGAIAETVVSRWLTPAYAAAHPELVARLQAMVAAVPDEGYAACCGAIERMDLRGELARVSAPTLVIAGEQDPATPPEHARVISDGIPGARLEVLSPAAHLANLEQPDEVTRLIADHLADSPADSPADHLADSPVHSPADSKGTP